jgi:hypothetical protein
VIASPTTPPAALAAARELGLRWHALLENRRATAAIDARGQLGAVVLADEPVPSTPTHPSEGQAELVQRLLGSAVPLPAEAIGVGARWRVVTLLRMGAAVVKQRAEYTLVAATADRWTIELDIRRIGERQLVSAIGLPPDVIPELMALFREVKGTVTVTAAQPLPIAGSLTTELRVHTQLHSSAKGDREAFSEDLGSVTLSLDAPPQP